MKFLNKLKNITCLEIVLVVLIISLVILFFFQSNKENFVEEKETFIRNTDKDIYDNFYANIYDELLYDAKKDEFEINYIFPENNANALVLDVGSGTGHHTNLLNNLDIAAIGIDNSPAMVNIAQKNYPELNFRVADMLDTMEFQSDTFTHIMCLYFTIYYIKDKRRFLENCYKWLKPNGVLVIHLVNMKKFDPILPVADLTIQEPNKDKFGRNTKTKVNFDIFNYKSNFILDENVNANSNGLDRPNATFRETFKFNNKKKTRINEHHLYMSSQQSILAAARDVGFILQSQIEMAPIEYSYNYLYTLVKPS